MQNLFKDIIEEDMYRKLDENFSHPGILLFRGKELTAISRYIIKYPLGADNRVLDLGCGEGHIGNMLFNKIDVGLDILQKEAQNAKSLPAYKEVVVADVKNLPFKSASFNVIFSNSVIEHIEGVERILEEGARVLKEKGLIIFTVPSHKFSDYLYFTSLLERTGFAFFGLEKMYSKARNKQLSHFNLLDDVKWQQLLNKFSLKVTYKSYYLSHKDTYEWDKMSILLRIANPLSFLHRYLEQKFYKKVNKLLAEKPNLSLGAGLLIVARKQ